MPEESRSLEKTGADETPANPVRLPTRLIIRPAAPMPGDILSLAWQRSLRLMAKQCPKPAVRRDCPELLNDRCKGRIVGD
jgi:hypothetical protein